MLAAVHILVATHIPTIWRIVITVEKYKHTDKRETLTYLIFTKQLHVIYVVVYIRKQSLGIWMKAAGIKERARGKRVKGVIVDVLYRMPFSNLIL